MEYLQSQDKFWIVFDLDPRTFVKKPQGRVERSVKVLEEQQFGFDCVDRNVILARSVYVNKHAFA